MNDIDYAVELASLVDVPILRAGKHYAAKALNGEPGEVDISEEELDEILEGSQVLAPIVKESIGTGFYQFGDESVRLPKMPGFINFVHDGLLKETLKERTKNVNVEYGKKYFENPETGERVAWITQTFRDVPTDIAEAIKTRFPKRSVELMPFTDPTTGKQYKMAVRSTAFLNNDWRETRPAVSGQDDKLNIEFSQGESPVLILFSGDPETVPINTQQQEDIDMTDIKAPENGIVTELQEKLSETVSELQAYKELHEAEKEERVKRDAQIIELQEQNAKRDVIEFMKDLTGRHLTGADGVVYTPSKAFCDIVRPLIEGTSTSAVIELAEGTKPARQVITQAVNNIVDLASKNGGMLVALGQLAPGVNAPPEGEEKVKSAIELMEELQKDGLSASDAWKTANESRFRGGN